VAALTLIYFAAAGFGLRFASIGRSISLIWPPTGIAIAALTLLGLRYWPGVTLGAFLANLTTMVPTLAAVGIAAGNTLEAVAAAAVLRRVAGARPRLESPVTARALFAAAVPLGALIAAVVGVSSLAATGVLPESVFVAVATWWAGDVLGGLVVAPALFAWLVPPSRKASTRGAAEVVALGLGTILAAELLLGQAPRLVLLPRLDYLYLLFPFVIWGALRFGARGATLTTLMVAGAAVWHTTRGGGPFIGATGPETLFATTWYLAVVAVTGLTLAAAVAHERGEATAALEHREAQLRVALDAARMGTWSWSARDDRLTWDDEMRRVYEVGPEERIASYQDFLTRVHPEDREFVAATVDRAMTRGGRLDFEFRAVLPDGRVRWIADQGRVLLGADGTVVGLTGVCCDVTDRRITEEQLRQAHRMESVGRLAGGVAHEANNQMSVVMGVTEFLRKRDDLAPEVLSDVEHIRRAAERTAAVTAQLLAFSRRQVLNPVALDLNEVVRRFLPLLHRTMGEDCTVSPRLHAALGRVQADRGQLEQVLLNLALNARDAMPGGGTLTVETFENMVDGGSWSQAAVAVAPGRYAVLAVSDTGQGMDRDTLARVFEPFFTTKAVGRGSGLGLSTVYGIVKQSGGYVWAYSEPGQGSTFKVYLPVTSELPAAPPVSEAAPLRRDGACGELILVAEDEEQVRRVAARALREAGFRVLEAANGRAALELLAGSPEPVRLVLSDVVMPEMNGRELADRVAEVAPGTRVLFTSGYTDSEILRRGLLHPDSTFLSKPFTPDMVVRLVREQLDGALGR
jgi:PAS domain S-box-containing protein